MVIQGYTTSASEATPNHRVKVTVTGICDDVLMDTVNGLYLRKGEQVFVYFAEDYLSPLVLGRVSGQFELSDLCQILNNFITTYNNHVHAEYAALTALAAAITAAPVDPADFVTAIKTAAATATATLAGGGAPLSKVTTVKPDDLLF